MDNLKTYLPPLGRLLMSSLFIWDGIRQLRSPSVFAQYFAGLRKGLDSAIEQYNRAVGSLEARVLPQARKFKDLGAGGEEDIPNLEMLDRVPRQLSLAVVPNGEEESADPSAPAEDSTNLNRKLG